MKSYLLFVSVLCAACSTGSESAKNSPMPTTPTETAAATGRVVDEQNGFRTVKFGQPVSAISDLELLPVQTDGPIKIYAKAFDKEDLQFGPARVKQVRYEFANGKFCRTTITALGVEADKLLSEVKQQYGPGRETDKKQVWWEGQQVTATYQESGTGNQREANFYIWNKSLVDAVTPVAQANM